MKSLVVLTLLFAILTPPLGVAQQQWGHPLHPLPEDAEIGATEEARAAFERLSDSEKKQRLTEFEGMVKEVIANNKASASPINTFLSFVDGAGATRQVSANANTKDSKKFGTDHPLLRPTDPPEPTQTNTPNPTPSSSPTSSGSTTPTPSATQTPPPGEGLDDDGDGLPETFENNLANGFTPYYSVSAGESGGTGFATFLNSVPQTVNQVFGSVPPRSYFRVKPLGIVLASDNVRYGLIQLDYLTLWNRDDGLVSSNGCIGGFINTFELTSHPLDNERSAVLVAAPIANGTYDLNHLSYKIYVAYTAAHEGTFFDQSYYVFLDEPLPYNNHLRARFSRSKHATYPFEFDDYPLPLTPWWVIVSTYALIWSRYHDDPELYLLFMFIAYEFFFQCVVDVRVNQGERFADSRINVGELRSPLNSSGFINDPALRRKLNSPIFGY